MKSQMLRLCVIAGLAAALGGCKFGTYAETRAEEMVRESLHIAADICIYTNHNLTVETLS